MSVLSVTEEDDFLERIGDKYEVCILIQSSVQKPVLPAGWENVASARGFVNDHRRVQAIRLSNWVESQYIIGSLEETTRQIAAVVLTSMTTCCNRGGVGSEEVYTFQYYDAATRTGRHVPSMKVFQRNGIAMIEFHFMEKE